MLEAILRFYSYLFHLVVSLGLLALAGVALLSGNHNLRSEFFLWTGRSLTFWLLGLGLAGLASIYLAWKGVFRFLFLVWTVLFAAGLARGVFWTPMRFAGMNSFLWALLLLAGALLTIAGAYSRMRQREARGYR